MGAAHSDQQFPLNFKYKLFPSHLFQCCRYAQHSKHDKNISHTILLLVYRVLLLKHEVCGRDRSRSQTSPFSLYSQILPVSPWHYL